MSRNNRSIENHPIEQEELMAYLDGELATERAVEAAAHMERCEVCQELAAELKKMSQEMMAWEVEELEPAVEMPIAFRAALQDVPRKSKKALKPLGWRVLLTRRGMAWAGGAVVLALLIMMAGVSRLKPAAPAVDYVTTWPATPAPTATPEASYYNYDSSNRLTKAPESRAAKPQPAKTEGLLENEVAGNEQKDGVPELPMIARTAGLTLVAKEFEKTRASLEEILKRHNGYIGELNVSAPGDSGRTLTATLRIPAPQLEAALAELKQLGRVENESQGGEEVTQQYVDLAARLANAQHTEQRLVEMLRSRTGKLQDVLKVELEIDRVRGEIEQMQAEKKELTKRVAFATLNTTVKEEYQAKLEATPPSTGSRFRNAAVDGYNTVVEGLIDVGLFLLSSGPSLLLWAAILFFPARWAWRKVRAELKKNHEQEAS
jgi:anti-sigma factor RsiW